jgi:small-conductance mechanosensitive channel
VVFIAMLIILLQRFGEGTTSVLVTSAMGFTIALACSETLKDWFAGAIVLSDSQYRAGKPRPLRIRFSLVACYARG